MCVNTPVFCLKRKKMRSHLILQSKVTTHKRHQKVSSELYFDGVCNIFLNAPFLQSNGSNNSYSYSKLIFASQDVDPLLLSCDDYDFVTLVWIIELAKKNNKKAQKPR